MAGDWLFLGRPQVSFLGLTERVPTLVPLEVCDNPHGWLAVQIKVDYKWFTDFFPPHRLTRLHQS